MERLAPYIAVVITIAWVASLLWSAINPEYAASPYIHAAFMLVAGALFGEHIWRRSRNGE